MKWSDFKEPADNDNNSDDSNYEDYDEEEGEETDESYEEHVPNKIHFKHSKSVDLDEMIRNINVSRDKPSLDNPGDIYKTFYQPKSILKTTGTSKTNASLSTNLNTEVESEDSDNDSQKENTLKFEPLKVIQILKNVKSIFLSDYCLFLGIHR